MEKDPSEFWYQVRIYRLDLEASGDIKERVLVYSNA